MIQRCRHCGIFAGGLVSASRPMNPWPESGLCQQCVRLRDVPTAEETEMLALLERACSETAEARKAERAGESIPAEIMAMRLKKA